MICASGSSADMVGRRKKEEEGDVFVELNHLMAVELMLLCILREGREGGREGRKEEGRKRGKEGSEGVREGGKEGGRKEGMEGGRRERGREGVG